MAVGNPRGRLTSWIAVGLVVLGFLVGGFGLVLGPQWWMFWTGTAIAVAGAAFGAVTGIMNDVH